MAGRTGPPPASALRAAGRQRPAPPPTRWPPAHERTAGRPGVRPAGPARCGRRPARTSGCARWPPAAPQAAALVPPPTRPPPCARAPDRRARAGAEASRQTWAPKLTLVQLKYTVVFMKRYGQACAIARALDVVGERWSLLLVRELILGPRRYRDL